MEEQDPQSITSAEFLCGYLENDSVLVVDLIPRGHGETREGCEVSIGSAFVASRGEGRRLFQNPTEDSSSINK